MKYKLGKNKKELFKLLNIYENSGYNVDNKNNELEMGENVQRDIPEIANLPPNIEVFDIDNKSGLPARGEETSNISNDVSKISNTYAMYGLIIVIIVFSASIGFLYSEVKELQYIISSQSNETNNNQYLQHIEATNNELKSINQHIEKISQDIALQQSHKFTDDIIELDKKRYNIGEMMNVIVKDADMNINPSLKDEVSVIIKNMNEEQQIVVKLAEVTDNSGLFTGKVLLIKKTDESVSGLGMLGVNINDSIVAVYHDENTVDGGAHDVIASANITG